MSIENEDPIPETFYQTDPNIIDIITTEATHPELEILDSKIASKETWTQSKKANEQNKKYLEIADISSFSNIQTCNFSDSVQESVPAVSLEILVDRKEYIANATGSDLTVIHSSDMAYENDCKQPKFYQNLLSTRQENSDQFYEKPSGLPIGSPELNSNTSSSIKPSIDEICSFEYIKNLIVNGPKLSDIAASDIYGQLNMMANEEQETDEGSAEYNKYIANLETLDQQLYTKIQQTLVTASLEFKVRDRLSEIDDPTGDDVTDINVRAERYTAEFMERFARYKSEQAGSSDV